MCRTAGAFTRHRLEHDNDPASLNRFVSRLKPWSIVGLLATRVLFPVYARLSSGDVATLPRYCTVGAILRLVEHRLAAEAEGV